MGRSGMKWNIYTNSNIKSDDRKILKDRKVIYTLFVTGPKESCRRNFYPELCTASHILGTQFSSHILFYDIF